MGYGSNEHVIIQTSFPEIDALKAEKAYLKSSGFPFPNDLIAFWDFSEAQAPYYAKAGVDKFPLLLGGTQPNQVDAKPFGKGIEFNGYSDYLKIDAANVGALNVAKSGDEVTVIAWIKRPSYAAVQNSFVAGMWQEDDNNPKRQYGLFTHLPVYGGWGRVCGHVSRYGGASPGLPYSRDYSASGALIGRETTRCIGFTYDGSIVKSYLDGISDSRPVYTEPGAPNGQGLTYAKNPYSFDLGLNRTTQSDFTVGSVKLTSGMNNWFNGILGGLAIFRRALTPAEMMKVHIDALEIGDPIQHFDFWREGGTGSTPLQHYGWETVRGSTAVDMSNTFDSWAYTRVGAESNNSFLYRANDAGQGNTDKYGLVVNTGMKSIRMSQVSKVDFTMNNKIAGATVQFCIKVNDQWYATVTEYDSGDVGPSGADWSTGVLKSIAIDRDKTQWLTLNYTLGTALSLGAQPASNLPNGEVTGIGLLSKPMPTGAIIRIADLKLYP